MPIAKVQLPDGRIARFDVPEGTTPEQVSQHAAESMLGVKPSKPAAQTVNGQAIYDPTEGMSTAEKVFAGAGKAVVDTGRGAGQILRSALPQSFADKIGLPTQKDIDESKKLDAALMDTTAGNVGNFAGNVGMAVLPGGLISKGVGAARVVIKAAPYLASALSGGAQSGIQPVATGESRAMNTAFGAATGLAGQGLSDAAGKFARGASDKIAPAVKDLLAKADAYGIPVNAAQLSDSRFLKTLQSTLEKIPFTGASAAKKEQQQAFNRAVSKTFGEDTPTITRDIYAQAKKRIGGAFEDLTSRNSLDANPLVEKLAGVVDDAAKFGTDDSARAVSNIVDEFLSKADSSGIVPGKAYQAIDSKIGKLMKAGGEKSLFLGNLRDSLREGMDASISQADSAAWKQARSQYKALKTIRDLVSKDGVDGNISASGLMGRINASQAGKEANAMGNAGTLGELAQIGKQFVRDPIPDSGTASRMATLGLLGGGAAVNPLAALTAIGTGATANKALNSQAFRNYIANGGGRLGDILQISGKAFPVTLPAALNTGKQ